MTKYIAQGEIIRGNGETVSLGEFYSANDAKMAIRHRHNTQKDKTSIDGYYYDLGKIDQWDMRIGVDVYYCVPNISVRYSIREVE